VSAATAFVAGATGYAGSAVVRACVDAGLHTVAHVRPSSPQRAVWEQRFGEWGAEADSTPWNPERLSTRLLELGPSYVFALLGTMPGPARREGIRNRFDQVDYGLTAMLIDAAAPATRPRFVYLSAAGAAPGRGTYLDARYRAEEKLRASGMLHVIARPGLITGDRPESRPLEDVVAALCRPTAALLRLVGAARAAAWITPMTGDELATAMISSALSAGADSVVLEPIELQRIVAVRPQPAPGRCSKTRRTHLSG
jgi:nucleoside-diphosphate-sugar epimerase